MCIRDSFYQGFQAVQHLFGRFMHGLLNGAPGGADEVGDARPCLLYTSVDAVAQAAAVLRAVREDVPQMGVPRFAADFRTAHAVGKILFLDVYKRQGLYGGA